MADQKQLDKVFLNIAKEVSELSYCVRAKVGCVIVLNHNIISMGYNGTPSGLDNCCEDKKYMDPEAGAWLDIETIEMQWPFHGNDGRYYLKTKDIVLHAESNALLKAAKFGFSTNAATMYCTLSPCIDCAKLILQAGIKRIVYLKEYNDISGLNLLKNFVEIEKYV